MASYDKEEHLCVMWWIILKRIFVKLNLKVKGGCENVPLEKLTEHSERLKLEEITLMNSKVTRNQYISIPHVEPT